MENAPFCIVSVDAAIFKVTYVKQEHSMLPLVLPIQICLLLVCLQVACAMQGCTTCQSKKGLSNVSLLVHSVVTDKHCMLIAQFVPMFLQDGHVPAPATSWQIQRCGSGSVRMSIAISRRSCAVREWRWCSAGNVHWHGGTSRELSWDLLLEVWSRVAAYQVLPWDGV